MYLKKCQRQHFYRRCIREQLNWLKAGTKFSPIMVEMIGHVKTDLEKLHRWAKQQPVTALLKSNYAQGRLECYYGLAVDLKKRPTVIPGSQDPQVTALGDRLLPSWHSALLCKYPTGVGINPHRDHTCFQPWAVIVNIGEANFFEYEGREKVVTQLNSGDIVRINTKNLHGIEPVQSVRYSLTFRHIKAEFLTLPIKFPALPYRQEQH